MTPEQASTVVIITQFSICLNHNRTLYGLHPWDASL
jgi:hypothetical protein